MAVETLAIQQIGRGLFYLILAGWNAPGGGGRHYETVQASGYWYPEKQPETGSPRENFWPCGKDLQAITAPFDGVVLYQTHILGVSQGMPLLAYGKLRAEGDFPAGKQKGCYD